MTPEITSAIKGFKEIMLDGIPLLLKQNETAFLSIVCTLAAIDALSAYCYTTNRVGKRFVRFIRKYFPERYSGHGENLYKFRCRMLHNFSPAYFSLVHNSDNLHLQPSEIGDTYLSDDMFYNDMKAAALTFFDEVGKDVNIQNSMNARLLSVDNGGSIFF